MPTEAELTVVAVTGKPASLHRAHHRRNSEFGRPDFVQIHICLIVERIERRAVSAIASNRCNAAAISERSVCNVALARVKCAAPGGSTPSARCLALRTKPRARSTEAAAIPAHALLHIRCATGIMVRAWISA